MEYNAIARILKILTPEFNEHMHSASAIDLHTTDSTKANSQREISQQLTHTEFQRIEFLSSIT